MIHVKFGGIYRDRVAKKYRNGIKLQATSIVEVIEALNQDSIFADDLKQMLADYQASFVLGRSLAKGRALAPRQAMGDWTLCPPGQDVTLHIVPIIMGGIEITMAQIITAIVTTAISIGVNMLMSALFPSESKQSGSKRKSNLYENGLQTQREDVPCPSSKHLAQVWRGVNGERASSGVGF